MKRTLNARELARLSELLNLEDRGMLCCDVELNHLKSIEIGYCAGCGGTGSQIGFEGRKKVRLPCEYCDPQTNSTQ
tara:strand:+ start:70 stop:297 length:228 start_codon:yes stop_codon:yes gene_type:complete